VSEPTTAEADLVVAVPKVIGQHVEWMPVMHGRNERWTLSADVIAPGMTYSLQLRGSWVPVAWGFALLWNNAPIRRLDMSRHVHRNPDGTTIRVPHKHRWTTDHFDQVAYIPTDIDFADVNVGFRGFLAECSITLAGTYQPILVS
jgi:hypothetical protein